MTPTRLREYEAFDAVLRSGSVTRAAELLGLSQPAVSKLLRSLELATGLALFDRVRRRLAPTAEAQRLHQEVARLFATARRVDELTRDIRDSGHGELRIAALPMLGLQFLPSVTKELRKRHPGLRISLAVESSRDVRESLLRNTADIGFLLPLSEQAPLFHGWTIRTPAVAVLPKAHRLSSRSRLVPQDFEDEPFISLGRAYRMRHLIDALFDGEEVSRRMEIETQNAFVACELAALEEGITIVDTITAARFGDRVAVVPVSPSVPIQFNVLLPPTAAPSAPVHALMDLVSDVIGETATIHRNHR
jgi:DNA-binding transcriptional LysR family regulator